MSEREQRGRGSNQQPRRNEYTAFDRAMVSASQARQTVIFKMATDDVYVARVCSVDKYFIEIEETRNSERVWISKSMLVSVKVSNV